MIDHHEDARRVELLGGGTQAERRAAIVAQIRRELESRGNYLPTRAKMWKAAPVIVDGTVTGGRR